MKNTLKEYLFDKKIFVAEEAVAPECIGEVLYTLASKFSIRIVKGHELAGIETIKYANSQIMSYVPEAFYRGFPKSVLSLSKDEYALDQLFHYIRTYGYGNFGAPGYSAFEERFERETFREDVRYHEYVILTKEDAEKELLGFAKGLLASTRPINDIQFNFLVDYIAEYGISDVRIASKNTAIRLLHKTGDPAFIDPLMLSDVIKYVDHLINTEYDDDKKSIKNLNLTNKHRKFVTALMDRIIEDGKIDTEVCFEKQRAFKGLLHHIHYKPKCEAAEKFLTDMYKGKNTSVYSKFERAMSENDPIEAAAILAENRGSGAVLRRLNYLVSRTNRISEIEAILRNAKTNNAIILIQLLLQYANYDFKKAPRSFKFTQYGKLRQHTETPEEQATRKTYLKKSQVQKISGAIVKMLEDVLRGRLGKVYIDPDMEKIAIPLNEGSSMGGSGVLPKGSRIHINVNDKKLRAFTYWEKVNDIDLSATSFNESGEIENEFYWSTMYRYQSEAITYSGDQTSGYNGGSEYFDIDLAKFKEMYPRARYIVFANNVYSNLMFSECVCRAGYMLRDINDSGEVYEPKTVEGSFIINCESSSAYLFGLDLETDDFVWLNIAEDSMRHVAVSDDFSYLIPYFNTTDIINLSSLFEMLATEIVDTPEEADVILSDKSEDHIDGKEIIRSFSFERILELMN